MMLADFNGKNVCVLGYGREGKAMFRALEHYAPLAKVTVGDRQEDALHELTDPDRVTSLKAGYTLQSGDLCWLRELNSFDAIIISPGIPPQPEFEDVRKKITNATQIFLEHAKASGTMVIGVTGSKGKSTTSSLIHAILKEAGKDTLLLGNIGDPSIAHIDALTAKTIVVMEMSSYQLQYITQSPHYAVITSFFPEHLDYHQSLENYMDAKKHICRFQQEDDAVFFNAQSHGAAEIAKEGDGRKIPVLMNDAPVSLEETKLIGRHNLSNIALAARVAEELGIKKSIIIKAIKAFTPLPHRLQSLGVHHDAEWIDDAISTTPESTIAALDALGDRVHTIILGGQDRGYDFSGLAERIQESAIRHIILFPGSGPRIREALEKAGIAVKIDEAESMEEAVNKAKAGIQRSKLPSPRPSPPYTTDQPGEGDDAFPLPIPSTPVPIILLSTASPSYGMFKNFEEKGEAFARAIHG